MPELGQDSQVGQIPCLPPPAELWLLQLCSSTLVQQPQKPEPPGEIHTEFWTGGALPRHNFCASPLRLSGVHVQPPALSSTLGSQAGWVGLIRPLQALSASVN